MPDSGRRVSMYRALEVTTSHLASGGRLTAGMFVSKELGPRPEKPLEIYEYEACPFCRKVREALCALDLAAMVKPCPKGGTRYRAWVAENGGTAMFPYLVDPNTGAQMYESDDIVAYLYDRYGAGKPPLSLTMGPLTLLSSSAASAMRFWRGSRLHVSTMPDAPLELWGYEASPFCRLVREALCELELPYLLHNVAKGSPSRRAFIERSGRMRVPYLVDPNTGISMFESADICRYLFETYGA